MEKDRVEALLEAKKHGGKLGGSMQSSADCAVVMADPFPSGSHPGRVSCDLARDVGRVLSVAPAWRGVLYLQNF